MTCIVQIVCAGDGSPTPHDGYWVVSWNPHTRAGVCALHSTPNKDRARRFESKAQALEEWGTISNRQGIRPWDGKPNKPLTGLTIEITEVNEYN